jgi:hypothetical protein
MLSVLTTDQKGVLAEQAIVFEALKFGAGVFQPWSSCGLRPRETTSS